MQVYEDICQSSALDTFDQAYSAMSLATADLGKSFTQILPQPFNSCHSLLNCPVRQTPTLLMT